MDRETFMIEVENSHLRSKKVLLKKESEYAGGKDRLEQFYRIGSVVATNPFMSLIDLAAKHFTSIADMCKRPDLYNLKKWDEKVTDLRNYTYLLDALVRDFADREKED